MSSDYLGLAISEVFGSVLVYPVSPDDTSGLVQIGDTWINPLGAEVTVQKVADCMALADRLGQPQTLEAAIDQVSSEIKAHADGLRSQVLSTSTEMERAAWPTKAREAELYGELLDDNKAPLLKAEAQAAGISLAGLVATVKEKAAAYYGLEAQISGVKRKHLDAVVALVTIDDVLSYDWSLDWPQQIDD